MLLGHHASITALATAAGGKTCFGVQITQEPAYIFGQTVAAADAPTPITNQLDGVVATGVEAEAKFWPAGKMVPRDADMVVYAGGPGSDAAVVLSHILYGNAIYVDQLQGKRFMRLLEDASDCSGTAKEELEQSPINTFDPQKMYALIGIGGVTEDAVAHYISCECPSFDGLVPKGLFANGMSISRIYHPQNMRQLAWGIFSGAESLTVSFTGSATQKPGAILEFIELGNYYAVVPSPSGTPRPITPGGGGLGKGQGVGVGKIAGNIMGGIFGRR